ncbi:hypothetical protein VNO77_18717 [Canavalia gladiata]|uniref:Uncharacterized protein n=1 Tax=Canavalia gladiata TaxID=3824 RepID=A0AAN9QJW5_CANGL
MLKHKLINEAMLASGPTMLKLRLIAGPLGPVWWTEEMVTVLWLCMLSPIWPFALSPSVPPALPIPPSYTAFVPTHTSSCINKSRTKTPNESVVTPKLTEA